MICRTFNNINVAKFSKYFGTIGSCNAEYLETTVKSYTHCLLQYTDLITWVSSTLKVKI